MIKIELIKNDLNKILAAIKRFKIEAKKEIEDQMPYRSAVKYRENVFEAILTQKYASPCWDYSESYSRWKYKKMNYSGEYWELGGDLAKALSVKQQDKAWFAGIQAGIMDSGNKSYGKKGKSRSIAWYAKILEEGGVFTTKDGKTQVHKKRPVFRPELAEFEFTDWPKEGRKALSKIAATWK